MTTVLRKPNGLPSFAGRNFTVILSPVCKAFGPILPIPRCARAVAMPRVSTQSVVEPSGFLTATVKEPWGLTNLYAFDRPREFHIFLHVVHARERMMSQQGA